MKTLLGWLLIMAATAGSAADWRQFRGPNGSGVSPDSGFPVILAAERSIAWKVALPGGGISSPIVVGDRVILTCASGPRQERLQVICLNAADGSRRWTRQFWATGRTLCQEKTSVAGPTPVSDGRYLCVWFSSNDLVCLDLEGNLRWLRGLTRDYPNASNSLGLAASPIIVDDVVIVPCETESDSFAIGLDLATGVNRWKIERPRDTNWTSPVTMNGPAGTTFLVLQSSQGIHALDPELGRELWRFTEGASSIPSSVVANGVLYVPAHGITALRPADLGQPPVQVWRAPQLKPGTSSPVVLENRIYVVNEAGVLTCGDLESGKRLWQLRLKGPFSSTPVGASPWLYLFNEKGLGQVVDTRAPEGQVVSELNLGESVLCTPALAGGAIYVRSPGHAWKLSKP